MTKKNVVTRKEKDILQEQMNGVKCIIQQEFKGTMADPKGVR